MTLKTISVTLSDELTGLLTRKVATEGYLSEEEVIRHALYALHQRDQDKKTWEAKDAGLFMSFVLYAEMEVFKHSMVVAGSAATAERTLKERLPEDLHVAVRTEPLSADFVSLRSRVCYVDHLPHTYCQEIKARIARSSTGYYFSEIEFI